MQPLLGLSQRLPPSNRQCEEALLGAILANNSAFHRVAGFLKPEHFSDPINGHIYKQCARVVMNGEHVDAVLLSHRLQNAGILDEVGGTKYLTQLLSAMVGIINAEEYGKAIHECWVRRQVIEIGDVMVNSAFGAGESAVELIRQTTDSLLSLVQDAHTGDTGLTWAGEAVKQRVAAIDRQHRGETPAGIVTGFPSLDEKLGPLAEGDLVYLMAIRNAGKTALGLQIAVNVARRSLEDWMNGGWERDPIARVLGDPNVMEDPSVSLSRCPCVLFDSYEMRQASIADRILALLTGIHGRVLRRAELDATRAAQLRQAEIEAKWLPLVIDDKPGQSAATMAIRGRMVAQRRPIILRVTDNLKKVVTDSRGKDDRNDTYSTTSSRWKNDAAQWGRHIVLCHPRADAKRREISVAAPQIGDAPYGIDDDADFLIALHREEMFIASEPPRDDGRKTEAQQKIIDAYWARKEAAAGVAKLYNLKSRSEASNWAVTLRWHADTTMFSDPWGQGAAATDGFDV